MLLLLLMSLHSAEFGTSSVFIDCMKGASSISAEMLACGGAEIARVDARLNTAYRELMRTLPAADRARLRNTQQAWLRHHLRETRRLAGDPKNGSAAFLNSQRFELQDLDKRAAVLERMVAQQR